MNVDPEAKMTALAVPAAVKAFPLKLAPAVNTAPLLNVMALASAASSRCAPAVNVIEPLMLAVAPAESVVVSAVAVLTFSCEPASTWRSVPVPPAMVSVAVAPAFNVTAVLLVTRS